MSIDALLILIPLCCSFSTMVTELLKDVIKAFNVKLANNITALLSSVLTATVVCIAVGSEIGLYTWYQYGGCFVGCSLITWIGSMVGYDKLKQLILQIKEA